MKLLVVAGLYPPYQGARAEQAGRLVSALDEIGIEVRVLRDPVRAQDRKARSLYEKMYKRVSDYRARLGVALNRPAIASRGMCKSADKLENWSPDVVLSLSTPVSSHIVGAHLARRENARWAAFFSDPWPLYLAPFPYSRRYPLDRYAMRGLKQALASVDMVFAPTLEITRIIYDGYQLKTNVPCAETFHCSPSLTRSGSPAARRSIIHAGDLTYERCSNALLDAVKMTCKTVSMKNNNGSIFRFIGSTHSAFRQALEQEATLGLITFESRVSVNEALEIASGAAALMVVEADMVKSPFLPSKIADYAALGVPVVAVTNCDSALVRICGGELGFNWAPHDAKSIRDLFLHALNGSDADGFRSSKFIDRNVAETVALGLSSIM